MASPAKWREMLETLDLKSLTATASLNQSRTAGPRQVILNALVAKFNLDEAKALVLTNDALREVCKTLGADPASALSKEEQVGYLLRSNIHTYDVRIEQLQPTVHAFYTMNTAIA